MKTYRVRFVKPESAIEVTSITASSQEEAANEFMTINYAHGYVVPAAARGASETLYAAILEVSGDDVAPQQFIARYFYAGIGRSGGVRPPKTCSSMGDLCSRLGVEEEFFDEGWMLEERRP
ncbi:hypothetical protein ACUH78_16440 [Thauera sp. ZXT1-4]|uniref:hypothetical protein n=1 Tax=Thauera sp. ZXT1-4 TaxID=3460294 RepID=UPI004040B8FD